MADVKLLPCPWCGEGNSVVEVYYDDASHAHRVGCGACGVSTGIHPRDRSAEHAVATWNARANVSHATAPLHAEIERLRAEVEAAKFDMSCLQQLYDERTSNMIVHRGVALACSCAVRDAYSAEHHRAEAAESQRDMLAEALRECMNLLHCNFPTNDKTVAHKKATEALARASQPAKEQP